MQLPKFHVIPPFGWINDPNGLIYYRGQYHFFYQHFPYAPRWGTMHWGHATSQDLVHWQHHPIALYPSKNADRNGCFSGSAVDLGDSLHIYYAGIHYDAENPDDIHVSVNEQFTACQMRLISADGIRFDNEHSKKVIIPAITDPTIGSSTHTRDPKVWQQGDRLLMVLGTTVPAYNSDKGSLLIYESKDSGKHWHLLNRYISHQSGSMWECPDLFHANGEWILAISPIGLSCGTGHGCVSVWTCCDFDSQTGQLSVPEEHFGLIDAGADFYAPQTTLDAQGLRMMAGWLRMPMPFNNSMHRGALSLPRIVSIENGQLYSRPHPSIQESFKNSLPIGRATTDLPLRLRANLVPGSLLNIGGYTIEFTEKSILRFDRSNVFPQSDYDAYPRIIELPMADSNATIETYVDGGIVETFVNDGLHVVSQVCYGLADSIHCQHIEIPTFETL